MTKNNKCDEIQDEEVLYFQIKNFFGEILATIYPGFQDNQHLKDTPERVAKMFSCELFRGLYTEPPSIKEFETPIQGGYDQMIITKKIPFYSMCAHHFLPFFGTVSIGYIPNGKIAGLSKFARVVEHFSKKPQVQEQLTEEIVAYIQSELKPQGCGCVIKARHLCMEMRGIERKNEFITTALKGNFLDNVVKQEFLRGVD